MTDFRATFGRAPEHAGRAPGRVNLIGEHTDYNGGYVLPLAIPQSTRALLARREDDVVRVVSSLGEASYRLGSELRAHAWHDYVAGVTRALRAIGHPIGGFDALITSNVPIGAGLSSSAALEIALLRALRAAFDLRLSEVDLAQIARRAENEHVGAPVGIMDPLACALGSERSVLFIDTRELSISSVPLPDALEIVVVDSGVAHAHGSGDYRTRRAECERAAALLGVRELRDVSVGLDRARDIDALPPPLDRRARHVVSENARVLEAVRALGEGNLRALGALFRASHASMRDDFEVSVPAVDELVRRAEEDPAIYGARLTGGGFGGAIVALARRGEGLAAGLRLGAIAGARLLVPEAP